MGVVAARLRVAARTEVPGKSGGLEIWTSFPAARRLRMACTALLLGIAAERVSAGGPGAGLDTKAQHLAAGHGFLNRGLYELALEEYEKVLGPDAGSEQTDLAGYGMGVCRFRLGQFAAAQESLAPLRQRPDFAYAADVLLMIGQCDLQGQRLADAVTAFDEVLGRFPDHPHGDDAAADRVEAHGRGEQWEAVVRAAEDFATRWPQSPLRNRVELWQAHALVRGRQFDSAEKLLSALVKQELTGSATSECRMLLAHCLAQRGHADRALELYAKVYSAEADPHAAEALLSAATIAREKQDAGLALELLARLVRQYPGGPHHSTALLELARSQYDVGDTDAASKTLSEIPPDAASADAATILSALCDSRRGEFDTAARRLTEALARFLNSALRPEMLYELARAQVGAGRIAEAVDVLEALRTQFPSHALIPPATKLLAASEHHLGRFDDSKRHSLEGRGDGGGPDMESAFLAAENDLLAGRAAEAETGFLAFLKAFPGSKLERRARFRYATALYRLGKYAEAEPLLAAIAEDAKDDVEFNPAKLAFGDILFQRAEYAPAERWLAEYASVPEAPFRDEALLKLGLSRHAQRRFEAALLAYDALLADFPRSGYRVRAVFEKAQTLRALDNDDQAAVLFEEVAATEQDDGLAPYALTHLASMAAGRGEVQEAATLYRRSAERGPDTPQAGEAWRESARLSIAAGRYDEARQVLDAAQSGNLADGSAAQFQALRAIALARQGGCDEALDTIARLGEKAVDDLDAATGAQVRYERAWCLRESGRLDEAVAGYRRIVEAPGASALTAHALLELADIESGRNDAVAACRWLDRLRLLTQDASANVPEAVQSSGLYQLGVCNFRQERYGPAAEAFTALLTRPLPDSMAASAGYFRGECYYRLGRHADAKGDFSRIVESSSRDSHYGPSLLRLGDATAALSEWKESEAAFTDYIAAFPDSEAWPQAQFGLAWSQENQEHWDEAIQAYEALTRRHSGSAAARARFQIGECHFAKKSFESAVREFLKVDILYNYAEWSAPAVYEAGRCFQALQKHQEASEQFRQVVDRFAGTEWARLAEKELSPPTGVSGSVVAPWPRP